MAKKQLRVGMIGYGFMGRAHSNAYKQVGQFFPSNHEVVLKAACARDAGKIKEFADAVGLRIHRDRLAEARRAEGHRRHRHLHAEQPAQGNRARGRGEQEGDPVREAAGDEHRRGPRDGRGRREGRRAEHGVVQLPPHPRRHAREEAHRRGPARQASSTTAPSSSRTGRSRPTCRRAGRGCGGSTWPRPARA